MFSSNENASGDSNLQCETVESTAIGVTQIVSITAIKPSPENDSIYGTIDPGDHELIMLNNDIVANGIREPLTVTLDGYILSGHRRYAAAQLAGLKNVPIRRVSISRSDYTSTEWQRELASHNKQRIKSPTARMREALLAIDPDDAHEQLMAMREERDRESPDEIVIESVAKRARISKGKEPMLLAATVAINELRQYWPLTVRQVHYRLLNAPPLRHSAKPNSVYRNDRPSYSDLCNLLSRARLTARVPWAAITDETRPVSGTSYCKDAGQFIDKECFWFLKGYRRDLMKSQSDHIELIGEKMTIQSVIKPVAERYCIPMTIGRGYCSLDPRRAIAERFKASGKDRLILLMLSDCDPDGESIASSFAKSMRDDFGIRDIKAIKCLLTMQQVKEWSLPPNGMAAKKSSSQYASYKRKYNTDSVFELEAIQPELLQKTLSETIESVIDIAAFNKEIGNEKKEAAKLLVVRTDVCDRLAELDLEDFDD